MLGTILKGPEDSVTFKSTCERPEIQDVNVFNSTKLIKKTKIKMIKIKFRINLIEKRLIFDSINHL